MKEGRAETDVGLVFCSVRTCVGRGRCEGGPNGNRCGLISNRVRTLFGRGVVKEGRAEIDGVIVVYSVRTFVGRGRCEGGPSGDRCGFGSVEFVHVFGRGHYEAGPQGPNEAHEPRGDPLESIRRPERENPRGGDQH